MTDVRTETVPLDDGSQLRLTVAVPDSAVRGGIVVLHESRGITDGVRWLVQLPRMRPWRQPFSSRSALLLGTSNGLPRESEQEICRGRTGKIDSTSGTSSSKPPLRL